MSAEVATPGPFNDEENKNARLSCVLLVLRYHCAGASIGASQGEYSVKLLGTGLLAVSFSKEKETARRPTMQIFLSETYRFQKNANGTCMQSIDDISIAETARAHQIAARVFFSAFFLA